MVLDNLQLPATVQEYIQSLTFYHFIIPTIVLLYGLYVRKFRMFQYDQKPFLRKFTPPRGKAPPFWPNGWYKVCDSLELANQAVRPFDYAGRNIAVFRGTDGKVYATSAFCTHLGASLAIEGKVRFGNCIQCPFHGWTFSGETGENVVSDQKDTKKSQVYRYDNHKNPSCNSKGEFMTQCKEEVAKLDTYETREKNGIIFIWLHSKKELLHKPLWEPLDIEDSLIFRGKSVQYANCHIQEIGENGADIRHFDYLHTETGLVPFIKFRWNLKSKPARDPDYLEYFKHEKKSIQEFKMGLFKKYITEANRKYINILGLDGYIRIFGFEFHFMNGTALQVGPASVHMFIKIPGFRVNFGLFPQPIGKFNQRIDHNFYTSSWLPYWFSAILLKSEAEQVTRDIITWNYKIFPEESNFNLKGEADRCLLQWRNWFGQFYEGCEEFEKTVKENNLDW